MWGECTIDPLIDRSQLLNEFVADLSFWGPLLEVSKPLLAKKQATPKQQQRQALQQQQQQHTLQKSTMSDASSRNGKPMWRTAVDATSGKTYYYDAITRRTQWEKPAEIREMERRRRQEKKRMDKVFFASMEQNIRDSLNRGEIGPGVLLSDYQAGVNPAVEVADVVPVANGPPIQPQPQHMQVPPPIRSRTISGMDENMLQELNNPGPAVTVVLPKSACLRRDSHGRPPLPRNNKIMETHVSTMSLELSPEETRTEKSVIATLSPPPLPQKPPVYPLTREESDQTELRGEALLDVLSDEEAYDADFVKQQQLPPPVQHPVVQHVRRNTGTTIYAASTMMNPDVEKTIKCVCGVYRAHIVQASSKRSNNSPVAVAVSPNQSLAAIFSDTFGISGGGDTDIPSVDEIIAFYQDFYVRSQMEHDTIIMSLIYVERLIKEDTTIAPLPNNWRSVLFSCMVLASKVWDDLSMWNIDFSNVCGRGGGLVAYTLPRINQLELALLKALNFNVKVPASEYAKYYFLIRSMLLKSGLLSEETPTITRKKQQQPAAAQRTKEPARHRGTRSMNDYMWMEQKQQVGSSVCLEQLMAMTTY